MIPERFVHPLMNVAAVCCALAVPSLVFGRALIGVFLGLALILASIGGRHKEAFAQFKEFMLSHWGKGLLVVAFLTALNIPFSVRLDLSFEAWLRTWLLLGAVFYLVLLLRDKIDLILGTLIFVLTGILIWSSTLEMIIYKNHLNGFLLLIPLCVFFCLHKKEKLWYGVGVATLIAFLACVFLLISKASMIGFILMVLSCGFLLGFRFFPKWKVIGVGSIATALVAAVVIYWSQSNLLTTSKLYGDVVPIPVSIIDLHRQLIWVFSFDFIWESPWIGFGANASNYHEMAQMTVREFFGGIFDKSPAIAEILVLPAHPHNWVVEIMLDTGFIGLAGVVTCVVALFYSLLKRYVRNNNSYLLVLIAINVGYWGTGLLNFSFWSVWWQVTYFLAICLTYVAMKQDEA